MLSLDDIKKSDNVVELIEDLDDSSALLGKISNSVLNGFKIDEQSGESWRKSIAEAMDIARQVMDKKSFPWEGAANVKYPLICEAAINFAARVFPEVVPNDTDIVEMAVIGDDPAGYKYQRASRVSEFMSYQCATSPDWKEHIDRLVTILPVVGTVFSKTYYDDLEKRNCVELCPPDMIIINHDSTSSLVCARRITHILEMSINDIISNQRTGKYCKDVDIEELRPQDCDSNDDDYQVILYEQHCWLDLDEDGYKEPYVVIIHPESRKILRIVNRIKPGSIKKNKDGEVYRIEATQYFQDYHFMRSPDGGFYSMGFGQFLLPLNKAINSILNQLVDAGTLAVTQGGFLGKGLRLKGGEYRFKPFEWKVLDASSGTDLAKNVFPFPVREPSNTLLELLTLLINTGKELTSSTEAMNGSMSASNVASQTYNGMVEQGNKKFQAINKRFYDSLTQSFKKLYELNYYYVTDKEYQNILDIPEAKVKVDFDLDSNDVRPVADPVMSSMAQRMAKLAALVQLKTADPRALDTYVLQTLQFDKQQIALFLPPPDPNAPPPPETVKALSEAELNKAKANESMVNAQILTQGAPFDLAAAQKAMEFQDAQIQESATRSWKIMKDGAHNDQKIMVTASKMNQQEQLKQYQIELQRSRDQITSLLTDKGLNIKQQDNLMKRGIEKQKVDQEKDTNSGSGQE